MNAAIPSARRRLSFLAIMAAILVLFAAPVTAQTSDNPTGITAKFVLSLGKTGTGSGTVSVSPAGSSFAPGTIVTLTATPATGSTFTGWVGATCGTTTTCKITSTSEFALCGTAPTCQFTMPSSNVEAVGLFANATGSTFGDSTSAGNTFTLTTSTTGSGSGTVTASPSGPTYTAGAVVTLTASAATGSVFGGWAGDCPAPTSSTCTITMNGNHTVTATFTLSASTAGSNGSHTLYAGARGSGTVTANPTGPVYAPGTLVTLTATPTSGSTLTGWSIASCSASTTCKVPTESNLTQCGTQSTCQVATGASNLVVLANFGSSGTAGSYTLTTSTTGSGSGSISVSPPGSSYAAGTVVTLTATPGTGSVFGGWSGDCSTPTPTTCTITMNSNHTVVGAFNSSTATSPGTSTKSLVVNVSGVGTVASSPRGITCGDTCTANFTAGQSVLLVAAAGSGYQFGGWQGCATTDGITCSVVLTSDTSVSASFTPQAPATIHQGMVYSTNQNSVRSYLRFYNAGTSAGTVTVTLSDPSSGQSLGQWTSPTILPGTAPQYAAAELEAALPAGSAKPDHYFIAIQSQFDGTFQHVLYSPAAGLLSDSSTCDTGLAMIPSRLANVHSSQVGSEGFPSSVVLYNSGTAAATATLAIYDARNATLLGSYTTAATPPSGELIIPVATIESAIGVTSNPDMIHYVVTLQGTFTGYLRHLVNDLPAGVTTDMSAVCMLNGAGSTSTGNTH